MRYFNGTDARGGKQQSMQGRTGDSQNSCMPERGNRMEHQNLTHGKQIQLGVCYYPEHWDGSLWAQDLDRMLEAGLGTVRIAEFAWNLIEPREGVYTYDFFDRFLDLALEKGMQVIFCTPTATPPAWLTEKYPEVLNADRDGNLYHHGARRHYNYNSTVYRKFCRDIVEKSASHYGKHPAIVGWQLDNEFNCENDQFYSQSDDAAFRLFLQEKYHDLDALNQAWGTVFWNQTYTAWEEVHVPRKTNTGTVNPHRLLDYHRFISDSVCRFAREQADIIRKYCKPGDFITTNGMFANIDYQRMGQESLDVLMYDSYPNFGYCLDDYRAQDLMKDRKWSRNLAEVRAVSPIFGIMEQQSGANGWTDRMEAPAPRPGQILLWTMQSIAHGADYVSYFRWRTCTFGTEIYWHGILDYSGRENRRLREVREISRKVQAMQEVAGADYEAKVGIIRDYDNIWDARLDRWHGRVEDTSQRALFAAMQLEHVPFDYVYLEGVEYAGTTEHAEDSLALERLKKYQVLFYPHASILTRERMELLEQYVAAGGCLVMGCRTGYKDIHGKCVMDHLPGLAARVTGTDIPEYSFVAPDEGKIMADWDGTLVEAAVFHDLLAPLEETGVHPAPTKPDAVQGEADPAAMEPGSRTGDPLPGLSGQEESQGARVLARYASSYYAGTPALICNSFGKGKAYYFGGAFALDTARVFLEKLGVAEPYRDIICLPECCELAVRSKGERKYFFVLNYVPEPVEIQVQEELYDLWTGETVQGTQTLEGYGVKVLRK